MAGYLESDVFIRDFQNGKKEAIDAVYYHFYRDIFYFCRRLLDSREDAQDITSTCFINLFQKNKDFNSLINIKAFLYISARNQSLDLLRKRKTASTHQKSLAHAMQSSYSHVNDELDVLQLKTIEESIKKLPPRSRQVIELLFIRGKKYKEVAETLNISVRAVTESRQRGLTLLREMLRHLQPAETILLVCIFTGLKILLP